MRVRARYIAWDLFLFLGVITGNELKQEDCEREGVVWCSEEFDEAAGV